MPQKKFTDSTVFIVTFLHLQQSWSDKMIERIRNVIKRDRKWGVRSFETKHQYPLTLQKYCKFVINKELSERKDKLVVKENLQKDLLIQYHFKTSVRKEIPWDFVSFLIYSYLHPLSIENATVVHDCFQYPQAGRTWKVFSLWWNQDVYDKCENTVLKIS